MNESQGWRLSSGSHRYGAYRGGLDPLADLVDAGDGIDDITKRILDGQSVDEAFRELFRGGLVGRSGLAEMAEEIQRRSREIRKSGRLDGLLTDLRQMLDEAMDSERGELFPDPSDDARFREAQLDNLPNDISRAILSLTEYQWRSPVAREIFEKITERLHRDVIDQQFAEMSSSIESMANPESRAAMAEMMSDLNNLIEKHQSGVDATEDYRSFIAKHQEFFPSAPETLEEFIDELARRTAATQRMLQSMSPEQREQLQGVMNLALADLELQAEMARLQSSLRSLRPEFNWNGEQGMTGRKPLGLPAATAALADLADLEGLADQFGESFARANLDDIDEEAVERALGRGAREDLELMRSVQRQLSEQGYLNRDGDSMTLTPKAIRRIGRTALRAVFDSLDGSERGNHEVARAGAAGELTGTSRPWAFGDSEAVDVMRTLRNAVERRVMTGSGPMLTARDFEVHETETTTRAAVALLVDQSFSMVMNDTWRDAKTMALALHSLATTTYPLDAFQVISFASVARVVQPMEIPDLEASYVQGTNLSHALMLAGQFLDRHPQSQRMVMVVTDGEPTAHLEPGGEPWFSWPPMQETITLTVAQVDRMTRRRVPITWFRLGDDPGLAYFLESMARRNGGRVLAVAPGRLGDFVVSDFVRARSRRAG